MFAHHTNRCPDEYAKMNDKQTYTLETFTLIREIRQRENDLNVIRFLEKSFDLKPYFKTRTFEEQLGEFDQLRIQHRKKQYDSLMDALLDRTSELK